MFFFKELIKKIIYLIENLFFGLKFVLLGYYLKDVEWNYILFDDVCVVILLLKYIICE